MDDIFWDLMNLLVSENLGSLRWIELIEDNWSFWGFQGALYETFSGILAKFLLNEFSKF